MIMRTDDVCAIYAPWWTLVCASVLTCAALAVILLCMGAALLGKVHRQYAQDFSVADVS